MPLGKIELRVLSPQEQQWLERWRSFEGQPYEVIIPKLKHMSRKEYFAFTYAIDPRAALINSQEPGYREVLAYQRDKNVFQELRDYVWRMLYDR